MSNLDKRLQVSATTPGIPNPNPNEFPSTPLENQAGRGKMMAAQMEIGSMNTSTTSCPFGVLSQVKHLVGNEQSDQYSQIEDEEGEQDGRTQELLAKLDKIIKDLSRIVNKHRNMNRDVKDGVAQAVYVMKDILMGGTKRKKKTTAQEGQCKVAAVTDWTSVPKRKRDKRSTPSPEQIADTSAGATKRLKATEGGVLTPMGGAAITSQRPKEAGGGEIALEITQRKNPERTGKRRRERGEAVLITAKDSLKYSEILRGIKEKVKPREHGVEVKTIRRTRKGDILVELSTKDQGKKEFSNAIREVIGDQAVIKDLTPKATLKIRDMDESTEENEIRKAIETAI